MKLFKQKTWQFETSGIEGEVKLFGVNIFDYKWQETGKVVINGDEYLAHVVASDDEKHDSAKQAKDHGKQREVVAKEQDFFKSSTH